MPDGEDLVRLHGEYALRLARARLRRSPLGEDAAEDVVQEVWTSLLSGTLERIDPARGLRPYLSVMILNAVRQRLRSEARRGAREAAYARPEAFRGERGEDLEPALARLEPGERAALRWVYWEGLSHAAAARICGVSPGALASTLGRAREKLRRLLGDSEKPAGGAGAPV